jgi:hypothetical protein
VVAPVYAFVRGLVDRSSANLRTNSMLGEYFGGATTFYFVFVQFMARAYVLPAIVGVVVFAIQARCAWLQLPIWPALLIVWLDPLRAA